MTMVLDKEEATKKFVDLKKKAEEKVGLIGLKGKKAQVVNVLDISGSMQGLFQKGVVQSVTERSLATAVQFDDDGSIPVYPFGENSHPAVELRESDFFGFVDQEILKKFRLEGGTNYAGPLKRIIDDHFPGAIKEIREGGGLFKKSRKGMKISQLSGPIQDPVFVIFITDGNNGDAHKAEDLIRKASVLPMFIQFIGIGGARFSFLEKLDNLDGRFIDNAGFFHAKDIDNMSDDEFLDGILNEFPDYMRHARVKGLIV